MPELTRPDRVLIKVLQTAEVAEKVARCLKHQDARGPKRLLSGGSGVERDASHELVQDKAAVLRTLMGCISQTASIPQKPRDLLISTDMQHFGKWGLVTKGPCENTSLACEMRRGINLEVRGRVFSMGKKACHSHWSQDGLKDGTGQATRNDR